MILWGMVVREKTENELQNYHLEKRSLEDKTLSECQTGREIEIKRHQTESTSENDGATSDPGSARCFYFVGPWASAVKHFRHRWCGEMADSR
jgi:hypothetical protein